MDLTELTDVCNRVLRWWPLAPLVLAVGAVLVAFSQCGVADLTVRFAARLSTSDPQVRADHREEWLRHMQDMTPAERPRHAGSLLWLGVGMGLRRLRLRLTARPRHPVVSDAVLVSGSPRLARRALTTSVAALSAVAVPIALVALTAGASPSASPPRTTDTSFLTGQLQLVQSQTESDSVTFSRLTGVTTSTTPASTVTTTTQPATPPAR